MIIRKLWLVLFVAVFIGACGKAEPPSLKDMTVHKSPTCNCCKLWIRHLANAGFSIQVENSQNTTPVKKRLGVPENMLSCHTAEVAGYFIEGHVPVEDVERLLRERPKAKGLAVPGMPMGSPGMEDPSGRIAPYEVFLIGEDGRTTVFARHGS